MRSLFNGILLPEVAILSWPPLLLSKPCNQCAAHFTGDVARRRKKEEKKKKSKASISDEQQAAQSSANQVLPVLFPSHVGPFDTKKNNSSSG